MLNLLSGDERKRIKLHVMNDVESFHDIDSLRATVAAIMGCEQSDIEIVGIYPESSFIIVMLVKVKFAHLLLQKDQELMRLLNFNVDWIEIDDKVVQIQQSKLNEKMLIINSDQSHDSHKEYNMKSWTNKDSSVSQRWDQVTRRSKHPRRPVTYVVSFIP